MPKQPTTIERTQPLTQRLLDHLSANPGGACSDECTKWGATMEQVSAAFYCLEHRHARIRSRREPKGLAHVRKRYFALEHWREPAMPKSKPAKRSPVVLDRATPAAVSQVAVTRYTPPQLPAMPPPMFSAAGIGRYDVAASGWVVAIGSGT